MVCYPQDVYQESTTGISMVYFDNLFIQKIFRKTLEHFLTWFFLGILPTLFPELEKICTRIIPAVCMKWFYFINQDSTRNLTRKSAKILLRRNQNIKFLKICLIKCHLRIYFKGFWNNSRGNSWRNFWWFSSNIMILYSSNFGIVSQAILSLNEFPDL